MSFDALLELGVLFTAASIFDIPLNPHNVVTRRMFRPFSIVSTAIQNLLFAERLWEAREGCKVRLAD